MSDKERIKKKIKALLLKTVKNGATREEAASAIEKATELITQYTINEYELNEKKESKCLEKEYALPRRDFILYALCGYIADLNNCIGTYNKTMNFVTYFGFKTNLEICCYMHDLIFNALKNETTKFKKSYEYQRLKCFESAKTINKDFVQGFSESLILKLNEIIESRNEKVYKSTGTDLMIVERNQVEEILKETRPEIKEPDPESVPKLREAKNDYSYSLGREKGKKVNLSPGIETKETSFLEIYNERLLTANGKVFNAFRYT